MKKMTKIATLILSLTMAFTAFVGVSTFKAQADGTGATVVKNDGKTTDFVDYWWGGAAMSSVLNEQGETVVTLPNTAYGHRMTNGKAFNGTGTDIYTASISYTMTTGKIAFFIFTTAEFLGDGSISIVLNGALEGGPVVTVGPSHEVYQYSYPVDSIENVRFDIVCSKLDETTGGLKMSLKINGTEQIITYTEEQLTAALGTNRVVDEVFGGWESVSEIVVHDYNDSYRAAYLAETEETYNAVLSSIESIDYAGLNADSELDDIVAVYGKVKEIKAQMQTLALRNREKGYLSLKFTPVEEALKAAVGDDEDKANIVDIASYIDVFAATVEAGLDTKAKAEVAESLKTSVNLDALNDLIDLSEEYSEYASEKKAIYNEAKNKLADAKDALVLADIVAFEESVKDLSDNDKILNAGALKNVIFVENALADNQEDYQARVSAAAAILSKAVKGFAGELADSWDIYNVTFIKANENGGIDYFATDYYDDDPNSDVGISFRDKFQLDGFSINFTYTEGPTGANAWLGLHFFSELGVMHISDTDEFSASTGITTLIIPKAETTEFQMGYPKLYGNCPTGGWPVVAGGTVGTDINVRFAKDGDVYNVFVKMGEAEEVTLCVLDAAILETYLVNGEGYLNIGSCDKDLNTCKITINTINGQPAASFVAENKYVEEPENPENPEEPSESESSQTPSTPTTSDKESTSSTQKGCKGSVGTGSILIALAAMSGVIISKKRKED